MNKFSTIHVFAYGETQIIGKNFNLKVESSTLSTLAPFIDSVKAKRPAEIEEGLLHVIHIIEGLRIDFISSENGKSFPIKWVDIDLTATEALVNELTALLPSNV